MNRERMRALVRQARQLAKSLRADRGGNALMIVALGLPALFGGAGLAIDVAQWYVWQRELQFAVDQAALAGAWARTDPGLSSVYATRARQEFDANLQLIRPFAGMPTVTLANYNGGSANAVKVVAKFNRTLPFTRLLIDRNVTIAADAQASFALATSKTSCIVAVHPTASGAFTLGGSVSGNVNCGFAAVSNSATAMVKNGNSGAQAGWLVAAGGIDSGFSKNGTLYPNTPGMADPFSGVATPSPANSPARTYSCPTATPAQTTTTATIATYTETWNYTYTGTKKNNVSTLVSQVKTATSPTSYQYNQTVANGTVAGPDPANNPSLSTQTGSVTGSYQRIDVIIKTFKSYSAVVPVTVPANDGIARPQPGTYTTISIACETQFQPGIYVVDDIDFGQNKKVTGTDVMFVIRNSGGMHINSNSNITLHGITDDTLTGTYGYSGDEAAKLNGMLIFDPNSTAQFKLNGNASMSLDGTLYMPKREIWFNGNSTAAGGCMMIVASTITFTGNNDLTSICTPSGVDPLNVGGGVAQVKLVI
jgi:Flp pilus assembly protein TadG